MAPRGGGNLVGHLIVRERERKIINEDEPLEGEERERVCVCVCECVREMGMLVTVGEVELDKERRIKRG